MKKFDITKIYSVYELNEMIIAPKPTINQIYAYLFKK